MSLDRKTFQEIFTRIKEKNQDDYDVDTLLSALDFDGEQYFLQVGNDNVYIGTARDIHYERIYQGNDPEIIEELTKILKLLIKELSKNINSTELLRRFEVTDDCSYLLTNPRKIGYQDTFKILGMFLVITLASVLVFKNYIGYWWIETNSLWDWLYKIIGFLCCLFSIFFFLFGVSKIISNVKNILNIEMESER